MKKYKKERIYTGLLAICFYLCHAGYLLTHGMHPHLLWACHLGALAVGFGLLYSRLRLNTVGVMWLTLGNFMWILYLLGKGEFIITSVLTHLGGLIAGLIGVYTFGLKAVKYSWLFALAGLALLQQLCRWVTPAVENVNLAFRVHEGWEKIFPHYGIYLAVLFATSGAVFWAMETILRKTALKEVDSTSR